MLSARWSVIIVVQKWYHFFVQQDDECLSEKLSSFLAEFSDTLLRAAEQRDRRNALELNDLLTDPSFEINVSSGASIAL